MKKIFLMVVFVVFALTGCAALEKMEEKVCSEENEDIRNFAKLGYIDSGFTLENPKVLSIWDKGNLEENE